jgi:hypothetical protein
VRSISDMRGFLKGTDTTVDRDEDRICLGGHNVNVR